MKQLLICIFLSLYTITTLNAQEKKDLASIYDPKADAQKEIDAAVAKAKKEHKHVLLQIGGNWCIWCVRFHNMVQSDTGLLRQVNDNYEVVHVNTSPENKNEAVLAKLEYPQRFGYPVFVVLNAEGKRIHTQDSGLLEDGEKGYSKNKVFKFLGQWAPPMLNPDNYKKR